MEGTNVGTINSFKQMSHSIDLNGMIERLKEIAFQDITEIEDNSSSQINVLYEVAMLLKSLRLDLSERLDARDNFQTNIREEIDALEYEIAKVGEDTKTTEKQLESILTSPSLKSTFDEKRDDECMLAALEKDFKKEIESKKKELGEKMERKKCKVIGNLKKKVKELMIKAKENGKVVCLRCGKFDEKETICGRCHDAYYCNKRCQEQHWFIHKYYCKIIN